MLEQIIRPFQAPSPQGGFLIPASPSRTGETAVLTWGGKATLPSPVGGGLKIVCCTEKHKELNRESDKVKIRSKDDPDNFITVQRAKTLSMKKKENDSCGSDAWEEISEVAAEMEQIKAELKAEFGSEPAQKSCKTLYEFKPSTLSDPAGSSTQAPA